MAGPWFSKELPKEDNCAFSSISPTDGRVFDTVNLISLNLGPTQQIIQTKADRFWYQDGKGHYKIGSKFLDFALTQGADVLQSLRSQLMHGDDDQEQTLITALLGDGVKLEQYQEIPAQCHIVSHDYYNGTFTISDGSGEQVRHMSTAWHKDLDVTDKSSEEVHRSIDLKFYEYCQNHPSCHQAACALGMIGSPDQNAVLLWRYKSPARQ